MSYPLYGVAMDKSRVRQLGRVLGLTKPLQALNSDTLVTAHNPDTGTDWTAADIRSDQEWLERGNADDTGQRDGYAFVKLRDAEPLSEDNFQLTDVPGNEYELVSKWFRSKYPDNAGTQVKGVEWDVRDGILYEENVPGTLPDSNINVDGSFDIYNDMIWLRVDLFPPFPLEEWRRIYVDGETAFLDTVLEKNAKVSKRGGEDTPFYVLENPPGTVLLGLVEPQHVEQGGIEWVRLQR